MYKVFLADDEIWETIGLKKLIEKSGLPIQVIGRAENGIVALEQIEKTKPDILITDIRMPGLNGLELAEEIRKRSLTLEIIVLSGYAEFEYAKKAMQWGARDYLLKPVEQEELNQALKKVIDKSEKCVEGVQGLTHNTELENPTLMKQILREIQDSYTEEITLNSLAEKYNISVSRLSTRMKENLGMSFTKYLTSSRVQRAKELLSDESLSIEQIAEMVGYRDYFYFIRVFKKATGVSPSVYRKNL